MIILKFTKRVHFPMAPAVWVLLVVSVLFAAGCGGKSTASTSPPAEITEGDNVQPGLAPNTVESVIIPEGRTLTVRLLESISSKTADSGQRFDAELAVPIIVDGKAILPENTPMRGHVISAHSSGRLQDPGYLRLTLDSVKTPDGNWASIQTTSVQLQGKSHKKRNLTIIGGGTGLGAIIGAIAGGGKGAAIGAISGAGAGTAGAYATGKEDVTLTAERRLSFTMVHEVRIG